MSPGAGRRQPRLAKPVTPQHRAARRSWMDRQPLSLLLDLNQVAFATAFILYLLTILLEPRLGEEVPAWMNPGNLLWTTVVTGAVFILTRWWHAQNRDRLGRRAEWLLLVSVCIGTWAFMWQTVQARYIVYPLAGITAFLAGFAGYAYLGPGSRRVREADALEEAAARRQEVVATLPEWQVAPDARGAVSVEASDPDVLECPRCQLRARMPRDAPPHLRCARCRVKVTARPAGEPTAPGNAPVH